jgi:site-specific DNA-methyltransferase (cytosine-N4-specific)
MLANGHLFKTKLAQPAAALLSEKPYYTTEMGAAVLGDSLEVMRQMPDASVNLVVTSPPYALHFKKEYGNADQGKYIQWLIPFAREIRRILVDDGSFVLNVGGAWTPGQPTRSIYTYKLLVELVETVSLHLAQEFFWYNPAKIPVPAEWVTVRRIRVKDSVEFVWWLSKTAWPKANNRTVLRAYSPDMIRLNQRGIRRTKRPGGHVINEGFAKMEAGGSIPPNVIDDETPSDLLKFGNNSANDKYTMRCKAAGIKIHPARFPAVMPEFFIKLCTEFEDVVLDPFAGSNTTGMAAEALERRWIAIEMNGEYLDASKFRFDAVHDDTAPKRQPKRRSSSFRRASIG